MPRRLRSACVALVVACLLSACCTASTCIKDPPCSCKPKADAAAK